MNRLYYGDCLTIMRDEMRLASVDLIYLDPPFSSNRDYNILYSDETGRPLPDQVEAFCDTWVLDAERERAIRQMPVLMREAGIEDDVAEFWRLWMNALRQTQPGLLAYLSYMAQRLLPMRGLLKPTASVVLHCDPTASHYIKALMDAVFGHRNFRNEIIWKRTSAHNRARRFGPVHDTLLFYSKSDSYKWNRVYQPYDESYLARNYRHEDGKGRYRIGDLTGPGLRTGSSGESWREYDPSVAGRHWELPPDRSLPGWFEWPEGYSGMPVQERLDVLDGQGLVYWPPRGKVPAFKRYLSAMEGMAAQDVITDIAPITGGSERMGYATQKPIALLERIIQATTDKDDVVFDPFCGCATTLEAAHRLERKWIGIDIAIHAIKRVAKIRLEDRLRLVEGTDFTIEGVPRNLEGAQDLWRRDKYHFQKWAVEQVDGFVTTRRTADGGIDGRLYFPLHNEPDLQSMVLEVKGGANVTIADLRALHSVLEREEALMAGLIIMKPLGERKRRNFDRLMAEAGDFEVMGRPYAKMQILSVPEILEGKRFDSPGAVGRSTGQENLPLSEPA